MVNPMVRAEQPPSSKLLRWGLQHCSNIDLCDSGAPWAPSWLFGTTIRSQVWAWLGHKGGAAEARLLRISLNPRVKVH